MKLLPDLGLTFDDVLLLPGFTNFSRADIDLTAQVTKKIFLKIPLVSSPMDTVTESELAIALATLGGLGIIHRNLSTLQQVEEVRKVRAKKLLVGGAIGSQAGFESRVKSLIEADVSVIVVDSAHGNSQPIIEVVKYVKTNFPKMQVIAGNVATVDGAINLIEAGVDGLRVGMGPGAICTTRVVSGMGVPQISAIMAIAATARKAKVPIIADGGIKYSGDIVKALAAGASCVMLGSLFAATTEAPGKIIKLKAEDVPLRFKSASEKKSYYLFKEYRGMGSVGAMQTGAKVKSEGEFHGKSYTDRVMIAEGVESLVPVKGTVKEVVDKLLGGLSSGMFYIGVKTFDELYRQAKFIQITQASLTESHPHSVLVTNSGGFD